MVYKDWTTITDRLITQEEIVNEMKTLYLEANKQNFTDWMESELPNIYPEEYGND